MATSVTFISSYYDNGNRSSYDSQSFTPSGSGRVLVCIGVITASLGNPSSFTDIGAAGLTWTSRHNADSGANHYFIYTAVSTGATASQLRYATSDAGTSMLWHMWEVSGANTSSPSVQTALDSGGSGVAPDLTFGSAITSTSAVMAVLYDLSGAVSLGPPSGWTEDTDSTGTNPTSGWESCHRSNGETNTTVTWTGGNEDANWRTWGIEIAEGGASVSPPVITNTATIYTPTVRTTKVYAPLISNGNTIYAPKVNRKVTVGALIDRTAVIYTPTRHTTKVYVPAIGPLSTIYTPTVHTTKVYAPVITQTPTLYAPKVNRGVIAPFLNYTASIYTPEVEVEAAEGLAQPPFLNYTASIYTPAVHTTKVYAPLVSSRIGGAVAYAPTVSRKVAVGIITQTATIYTPAVHTTKVYVPFLDYSAVIYTPSTAGATVVEPPFLDYTATIYAPSLVIDTTHTPPLIDQTAVIYDPSVGRTVRVGALISITPTLFAPAIKRAVSPPLLSYGVVYAPSIKTKLTVGAVITRTATIYTPQVLFPGPLTLSVQARIIVEPLVFSPQVHRIDVSQHQHRLRLRSERAGTVF